MVDGMDGGMNFFMTFISSYKNYSKSELLLSKEEFLKDKSVSSRYKGYDITYYYISETESILDTWEKYFNLALKA